MRMMKRSSAESPSEENGSGPKKPHYMINALMETINKDEERLHETDQLVIIADKYPKARHHFLIIPKDTRLRYLSDLQEEHKDLLNDMIHETEVFLKRHEIDPTAVPIRYGFHMKPSLLPLHMHVISQDFDSPCLKTKKHWNSFTTEFFIDASTVLDTLEKDGSYPRCDENQAQSLLKNPLRCIHCKLIQKSMPKLKDHILKCPKTKAEAE